jgi:L-asparaginase / beta-aspartyl-peptidase
VKRPLRLLAAFVLSAAALAAAPAPYGLVLHGGAGVIERKELSPGLEADYRAKLAEARDAGYAVLERGGTAVDAVVAVIAILEDSPLFNAGRGAVLNADGQCELDASIMDGRTLAAGAIAGVHHIKNPIRLARDVMDHSEHVMLIGDGAEQFARSRGCEFVPNEYFQTEMRRAQLERAQARERAAAAPKSSRLSPSGEALLRLNEHKHGTVGCVALDRAGNLAAGTSTGGMTNKKFGRVGDSPIIGAGTYAANGSCAVSATGWGEYFIRVGVARSIAARVEFGGAPLPAAAQAAIDDVGRLGGDGGVIALDRAGRTAWPFNTSGMYRALRFSDGRTEVEIFSTP